MAEYAHLNKAPIVEALIDFRVKAKDGLQPSDLQPIQEKLKDRYPTKKSIRQIKAEFSMNVGDGAAPEIPIRSTSESSIGIRLDSIDRLRVLQAQIHGFTFSRLKPYDTWETLLEEAKTLWNLYIEVAAPVSLTRVTTRFINRLELPLPIPEFEEYLTRPPVVPNGIPESVSEFLSRIVAHDTASGASIVVIQALETVVPGSNILPVLLDIDVFKQANFDINSNDYWELLSEFRKLKNTAFFGSITERTKELFL
jgi:uncharacterized protein (TIGR04255 family)